MNVTIRVEWVNVIGCVRQKYKILQGTLPIDFVHKRVGEKIPILD